MPIKVNVAGNGIRFPERKSAKKVMFVGYDDPPSAIDIDTRKGSLQHRHVAVARFSKKHPHTFVNEVIAFVRRRFRHVA